MRGPCWIGFPAGGGRRPAKRPRRRRRADSAPGIRSKAGGIFHGGVLSAVFRAPRLPGLVGGDGGGGGLAWFGLGVYLVLFAAFLTMLVYVAPVLARLLESVARCASSGRRPASVRPLIEQHFGESAPWSLGLEEEVLILDAGTLALAPGVESLLAGVEGRELPGVLKMELLASMVELATGVCSTPQEALESPADAARRRRRERAGERPAHRRGRHAPVQPSAGAGHRARPAVPRVRRVRGHHGPAPGGLRAARPRRHARARGVHAGAGGSPALAAARAGAVGQLALSRR